MKFFTTSRHSRLFALFLIAILSCSEVKAENDQASTQDLAAASAKQEKNADFAQKPPRDLGQPLVQNPENLKKMHPKYPVWILPREKKVVLLGRVCQTNAPLEMFACLSGTKEHESVVTVPTEAFIVHGALLAVGAKKGSPVQFRPKYVPASGSEIEITVRWKNAHGKIETARAQDWVRNIRTNKPLSHPWVFGGSGFWKDESNGKEYYKAECGDFICVANFPSAMLDLPIKSSESNAELLFKAYKERIPPRGTPVTLILKPLQHKAP
ncbi:MAG: YdjY domain-containing protein [Thermoguttaceae bacterium]